MMKWLFETLFNRVDVMTAAGAGALAISGRWGLAVLVLLAGAIIGLEGEKALLRAKQRDLIRRAMLSPPRGGRDG